MILIDANLLVYAFSADAPEHTRARGWLDDQFTGGEQVALPWESLNAFARLVSNPRVVAEPVTLLGAWEQVERWLSRPGVWIPVAAPQHRAVMGELHRASTFSANDTPDIHLAALTISHGLRLATHDAGFARFDGLRWFDPLSR